MIKRMLCVFLLSLFATFSFGVLSADQAYAQDGPVVMVPDAEEDPLSFVTYVYTKYQSGEWLAFFGGLLIAVVMLLRWLLGKWIDWFNTRLGGWTLTFGAALLMAVGSALAAGTGFSIGLVVTAFSAALIAAGGWEALNDALRKPQA